MTQVSPVWWDPSRGHIFGNDGRGAVSFKHLEYYLDEFTFRFNRRTSRSRGKLFERVLGTGGRRGAGPLQDTDPRRRDLVGFALVGSLWRYPVKSMMGEELTIAEVTERGLRGDRAYALVDRADGMVATAKNPRKWPHLFDYRATFIDPPGAGGQATPVSITLPDGTRLTSNQEDCHQVLSRALAREVTLDAVWRGDQEAASPASAARVATAEEYWPDIEGLDFRDTVTDFALPAGTFFDCAVVHLLTTATLGRLGELYPRGRFDVRRFRPNIVVQAASGERGFLESAWVGHTLAIGDQVLLSITGHCGRCVMTTLPQGDLPGDPDILRTAAHHNHVQVGVYAAVVRGGTIRRGDAVKRAA